MLSNEDVASVYRGVKPLSTGKKYRVGKTFVVQPIKVEHNVPNYAYLIENEEIGRVLFCTDASSFPYKIKNLNHICIEMNHDESILIDNLCDNQEIRSQYDNHLSSDRCIEALRNNFSPSTQTIVLLHLSDGNSHAENFQKQVQEELGFLNVHVADKGMIINLEKDEF